MTRFARILSVLFLLGSTTIQAQTLPTVAEKVGDAEKMTGFFNVYWDAGSGKIWLEISRLNEEFLYVESQPAGLGSNDIGLDRNQLGQQRVVRFERVGPRILLVAPNLRFRADTDNTAERKAVTDAFPESILWGFKIEAESNGILLVDATDFVVRDAHNAIGRLRGANQGTFKLDPDRSAPFPEMIKSFPKNTEMEARLTFTGDKPGGFVRSVAADATSFTLRIRHSFIELPPPGFKMRRADPRAGYFGLSYIDYATQIGEDRHKRFIARHRLEKKDPSAAMSEPVEPIIYYVDPGTPEPIRSALVEGASWWNEAFEAAGFRNAFRVEVLPVDADPMDVRYNVINWVHRSTRGWSYGSSVTDPRTGEIIKGHVLLGSLRIRQDYLIAEGLLDPYEDGTVRPDSEDPALAVALARIRQLAAHEVGHTLGLQHNFAASVNNRASVMDYPAPLAIFTGDDQLTLSNAYDTGIGEWDKYTIRYGYTVMPDGISENDSLNALIDDYIDKGYHFITDNDARPAGAAQPLANLWDNGTNTIRALKDEMKVRADALKRFGLGAIRPGRPLATLEEVLVPLYLHHRYQIEATVKMVGGAYYSYAVRGDRQSLPEAVSSRAQMEALGELLRTLEPEALALPRRLRTGIPPRPPGYGQHRELFDGYTGLIFDPYAPAEVVAHQVLGLLLNPQRAARLVNQDDFDSSLPNLSQVLTKISEKIWEARVERDRYRSELQRVVQQVWTDVLLETAASPEVSPAVRARVVQHLNEILDWLSVKPGDSGDHETVAHRMTIFDQIDRYLGRPYRETEKRRTIDAPPGSPIGTTDDSFRSRQAHRRAVWEAWSDAWEYCGTRSSG